MSINIPEVRECASNADDVTCDDHVLDVVDTDHDVDVDVEDDVTDTDDYDDHADDDKMMMRVATMRSKRRTRTNILA